MRSESGKEVGVPFYFSGRPAEMRIEPDERRREVRAMKLMRETVINSQAQLNSFADVVAFIQDEMSLAEYKSKKWMGNVFSVSVLLSS